MGKRGKYKVDMTLEEALDRLPVNATLARVGRRLGEAYVWEVKEYRGYRSYTGETPQEAIYKLLHAIESPDCHIGYCCHTVKVVHECCPCCTQSHYK